MGTIVTTIGWGVASTVARRPLEADDRAVDKRGHVRDAPEHSHVPIEAGAQVRVDRIVGAVEA